MKFCYNYPVPGKNWEFSDMPRYRILHLQVPAGTGTRPVPRALIQVRLSERLLDVLYTLKYVNLNLDDSGNHRVIDMVMEAPFFTLCYI